MSSPESSTVQTTPNEPAVTVEIETFAKGAPKVRVKVMGDDPDETMETALSLYQETMRESLTFWKETRADQE